MRSRFITAVLELQHTSDTENSPKIFNDLIDLLKEDARHFKDGCRLISIGWENLNDQRDAYEEALLANGLNPKEILDEWRDRIHD